MKILAVLYRGGKANAAGARLLGTIENQTSRHLYLFSMNYLSPNSFNPLASVPWTFL
jgi:hypothetical protein